MEGSSFEAKTKCFVKHFSEKEGYLLLKKRFELFHYYSSEGVPHESELLKNALENGEWTQEKEDHILELKYHISDNEKNIHNIIPEQRGGIEEIIKDKKKELSEITWERKQILGRNIEDLIDEDINDFVSFLSFYKDEKCNIPLYDSYDIFQRLDMEEINKLNHILSIQYHRFTDEKIKSVACMPFFLNKFSYSKEDLMSFLSVPIYNMTHHQTYLFSLGSRNLGILSQAEGSPPDISLDASIESIVHWYDIQNSLIIGKRNQSK